MIKKSILLSATLIFTLLPPTSAQSDHDIVLGVLQELFDAMNTKDTLKARSLFWPHAQIISQVNSQPGKIRVVSESEFIIGMGGDKREWLERMTRPEVMIDNNMALIWTRYDFLLDNNLSHTGRDAVCLFKYNQRWRIASIVYTVELDSENP